MATGKSSKTKKLQLSKAEEKQREVREVRTKLKHMGPLAATEVVNEVVSKQVTGFVDFIREQSVVGLAVGLVLGTQVKQLVDSIVNNFFNPFIGLFLPGKGTLAEKSLTLHLADKSATFGWGSFVTTMISFIAVAAIVYFIFKALKLDKLTKKKE